MKKILLLIAALIMLVSVNTAFAVPTLQVYISGATAEDFGESQQSWVTLSQDPFTLNVIGAYKPNTSNIEGVTLLVSVPEGEHGILTISPLLFDETPNLLTEIGHGSASETNPLADADINILTGIYNNGYSSNAFLPAGFNANSHYPLQNFVSDFLIYDLSDFDKRENHISDYNAGDGTITPSNANGEIKEYSVRFSGFSRIHFDVYGLVDGKNASTWEINPGSHDATYHSPEPATLLLFGMGLLGLAGLKRKKS